MKTYKNIHTAEVLDCVKVEIIPNYPEPVIVYVLSDGSRWSKEQLFAHWKISGETP